jgi:hypothetical protein
MIDEAPNMVDGTIIPRSRIRTDLLNYLTGTVATRDRAAVSPLVEVAEDGTMDWKLTPAMIAEMEASERVLSGATLG